MSGTWPPWGDEGRGPRLPIDEDWLVRTLSELVRIDSVNPSLAEGGAGESEIAAYVAEVLREIGLEVAVHEPQPGRPSVVGRLGGARAGPAGPTLMWNAHYDTIGVEGMEAPFEPEIRGGRLYGRGAYDMKGSVAAGLAAARALVETGTELAGELLVASVADEEYASLGTADLLDRYDVDAAIVTEPSGLDLCLAHRGFVWIRVETRGRAAHGSDYEAGIDANLRMGRFLSRLEEHGRNLRRRPGHWLLGPPSLHAPLLRGGTGLSTYADRSALHIERRTVPRETVGQVEHELRELLAELADEDPTFVASLEILFSRDPFETDEDAEIVKVVRRVAERVLGREPAVVGESPWMDSALLAGAGVDTVVFGPAGGGAHASEEWVDLASVARLARILAGSAVAYCGAAGGKPSAGGEPSAEP